MGTEEALALRALFAVSVLFLLSIFFLIIKLNAKLKKLAEEIERLGKKKK